VPQHVRGGPRNILSAFWHGSTAPASHDLLVGGARYSPSRAGQISSSRSLRARGGEIVDHERRRRAGGCSDTASAGGLIHFPAVVCTSLPAQLLACAAGLRGRAWLILRFE
jgi:hypothetical protein